MSLSPPLLQGVTRHAALRTGAPRVESLVTVHPLATRYYLRPSVPGPRQGGGGAGRGMWGGGALGVGGVTFG